MSRPVLSSLTSMPETTHRLPPEVCEGPLADLARLPEGLLRHPGRYQVYLRRERTIQAKVGSVSSPDIGVVPKAGLAHQREVRLLPSLLVDVRLDGQPSVSARHAESGGWRSRLPRTRGVAPGALHAENCSHDVCEGIILPSKQERLKSDESVGRCRGRRAGCGGGQA